MYLYLVRHPEPKIAKGVCYGQADIPFKSGTLQETLRKVKSVIPQPLPPVISSPLKRCTMLAKEIGEYSTDPRLMELDFGDWERKNWNEIPLSDLKKWMKDYMNECPPGGESGLELHSRVGKFLSTLETQSFVIIGHLGTFRSLYAHANKIGLPQAFEEFNLAYGGIYCLKIE